MQIANFTYTKADGSTSNREVLVHTHDEKYLEGTDMSELSEYEKLDVIAAVVGAIDNGDAADIEKTLIDIGLRWNYRKFKLDRATNLTTEFI